MRLEQWQALAARIRGFTSACQLCGKSDNTGALRNLRLVGLRITEDLRAFLDTFEHDLPARSVEAINACADPDRPNSAAQYLTNPGARRSGNGKSADVDGGCSVDVI